MSVYRAGSFFLTAVQSTLMKTIHVAERIVFLIQVFACLCLVLHFGYPENEPLDYFFLLHFRFVYPCCIYFSSFLRTYGDTSPKRNV